MSRPHFINTTAYFYPGKAGFVDVGIPKEFAKDCIDQGKPARVLIHVVVFGYCTQVRMRK